MQALWGAYIGGWGFICHKPSYERELTRGGLIPMRGLDRVFTVCVNGLSIELCNWFVNVTDLMAVLMAIYR